MRLRRTRTEIPAIGWGSYRSTRTYEVSPPLTWDNADEIAEWCSSKPNTTAVVGRDYPERKAWVRLPTAAAVAGPGARLAYETTLDTGRSSRWFAIGDLDRLELLEDGAR